MAANVKSRNSHADRNGGARQHIHHPRRGTGHRAAPARRDGTNRGAGQSRRQHRQRQPPGSGRDRVRLHGGQLDRSGKTGRGAICKADRYRDGGADERRAAVLHRVEILRPQDIRRPQGQTRFGRAGEERHDAACPHLLPGAGTLIRRDRAGLPVVRRRRGGAETGRGGCAIAVPDSEQDHDSHRRKRGSHGAGLPAGATGRNPEERFLLPAGDDAGRQTESAGPRYRPARRAQRTGLSPSGGSGAGQGRGQRRVPGRD